MIKKRTTVNRRSFLRQAVLLAGAIALQALGMRNAISQTKKAVAPPQTVKRNPRPSRLIYVAIDALHPNYFNLDSRGNPGGREGNWLMPNIREFLKSALWYPNALAYLPAATDMNHLNAIAGTSSAQTGIIGVWAQPSGWGADGRPVLSRSSLSFVRDGDGMPVDTLFHAWKRKWPDSKTLFISGKEWVAEMFRDDERGRVVDLLVTGKSRLPYLAAPAREGFADPATDGDAACDPESGRMGIFDFGNMKWGNLRNHMSPSSIWTRLYTGQGSLLTAQMERFPEHFPHDRWVVESALEIFRRDDPDLAYILLAQCDDGAHCIGTAWDPAEFVPGDPAVLNNRCEGRPDYNLASARNHMLAREAILDCIRDVDIQFGRLMRGFARMGVLRSARIILLSDHSSINHLSTADFHSTDVIGILESAGMRTDYVYAFSVSSYGVLYWRERAGEAARARAALMNHRTTNPQTGARECPWVVLDRNDMVCGVTGVCLPGELNHRYFVGKGRGMLWPDLIVLAKNGWQIPVYNGHVPNVGISVPRWMPAWRVYNGGHGSTDTLPIVAAVSVPGGRRGVNVRPIRIADIGATAASLSGLRLGRACVGRDLSHDLA
jgi:hypothetical protein